MGKKVIGFETESKKDREKRERKLAKKALKIAGQEGKPAPTDGFDYYASLVAGEEPAKKDKKKDKKSKKAKKK